MNIAATEAESRVPAFVPSILTSRHLNRPAAYLNRAFSTICIRKLSVVSLGRPENHASRHPLIFHHRTYPL